MSKEEPIVYDVIIVGGGPAGLSAALVLGRCRRRVLLCDAGHPRNAHARHLHGYLTRDGENPLEMLRIARQQLQRYDTIELRQIRVTHVECLGEDRFTVTLADGTNCASRKLLLATGVVDELPQVEGFDEFYGTSVHHCPYCDGWEVRDQPIAVYGKQGQGVGLALELTNWSRDLVLCTDGPVQLTSDDERRLRDNGIRVRQEEIVRLEGRDGKLERITFVQGEPLERAAMFFSTGQTMRSGFAAELGCEFTEKGVVSTGKYETTNIPGLYVAGDASHNVQFVIVAAAEGAEAAVDINKQLIQEELK